MQRRIIVVVLTLLLVAFGAPVAGAALVGDDSDASTWVTEPIPGTVLTMQRPATWTLPGTEAIASTSSGADATALLVVANPANGDNVVVNRWDGKNAGWYENDVAFRRMAKVSAEVSDGKLLATGKRTIGGMPAYWEIETYRDPASGDAVVYAEFEIRTGVHRVLTLAINVSKQAPHARQVVENFVDGVDAT